MAQVPVSGGQGGNIVQATPLPDPQEPNRPGVVPLAAFGAPEASATSKAASDLMAVSNQVANVAISQAQQDGRTKRTLADAAMQTGANTILDGNPNDPNDVGFNGLQGQAKIDAAPGVISRLQANRTAALSIVSSLPQPEQDFYAARSATTVSDQLGRVTQAVAQAKGAVSIEASNGRMFATTQAAGLNYSDPQAVQDAFVAAHQEMANIAKVQGLPPDAAAEQLQITQGHIAQTIVNSALSDDPSGNAAAQVVKSFPTLPSDVTASINNAIFNAQQKAQVAGRATLTAQLNDNLASIARTGAPIHMGISPAQITSTLGADEGARVNQQLTDAGALYNAQKSSALTSPAEDAATLARMQPGPGSSAVPGLYASQAGDADTMQKALVKKWTAIQADPAAYVSQANPAVGTLIGLAQHDPSQWDVAAAEINRNYDRLGIAPSSRTIIPAPVAQSMVSDLMASPEKAPAAMQALQQGAGAAWPQMSRDLASAGLPATFQAVGALDNSADAAQLAGFIAQVPKGKTADDLIGAKAASTIKNDIRSNGTVQQYTQSLTRSGASAGQVDGILSAMDSLAYAKLFDTGDTAAAAHSIASFTGNTEFMPNGGARVPAAQFDTVSQNAQATLNGLTSDTVAIPPIFGKPGQPSQQDYLNLLKANPTWITSPHNDALMLMDHGGRLARGRNGQPITVPFNTAPMPNSDASPGAYVPVSQ